MHRLILLALSSLLMLVLPGRASGPTYVPPAIQGYVTDTAKKLTPEEVKALDEKVYIPASLGGHKIEDVGDTFNTWKIGEAEKVFHVLREKVTPRLNEDWLVHAIDDGAIAVGAALSGGAYAMKALTIRVGEPPPAKIAQPPPKKAADPHFKERIAMSAIIFMFVVSFCVVIRTAPFTPPKVGGIVAACFAGATEAFWDRHHREPIYDIEGVSDFFAVCCLIVILAILIAFVVRKRRAVGPFPDGGGGAGDGRDS